VKGTATVIIGKAGKVKSQKTDIKGWFTVGRFRILGNDPVFLYNTRERQRARACARACAVA
jgi:hypothetical protein